MSVLSHFSRVRPFVTLWTVACQTPLSLVFSRQEYWSGLPCLPPEDLPNPGIEPTSLMFATLADRFFTSSTIWEALSTVEERDIVQVKKKAAFSLHKNYKHFFSRSEVVGSRVSSYIKETDLSSLWLKQNSIIA